jgi:3-phosphoglycerate kinase
VIGGAKVRDKIKVLKTLISKADVLLIGGKMAFTFLAAEGVACGRTQIEEDWLEVRVFPVGNSATLGNSHWSRRVIARA